nr:MAG TPA: Flagellar and Swarming motility protein [Bacteriophage sp.]
MATKNFKLVQMVKFIKLTLAHNEQPIYVNVASIESFRAHMTDDKEDGSYVSTTSMRGDDAPIIVKETCDRIYHSLYWEDIENDGSK